MMNNETEIIILRRDCDALLVPSGAQINLPKGTEVTITQSLGGSHTVNVYGNLARIDNEFADALGKETVDEVVFPEGATLTEKIWIKLKTCYDPEIPVNVVDLGLVYDLQLNEIKQDESTIDDIDSKGDDQKITQAIGCEAQYHVDIQMTLTAPGCGMGPVLMSDVKYKVESLSEVEFCEVSLVFDPPWDREMMSDEAKLALNLM